jgi:hypothetical protein
MGERPARRVDGGFYMVIYNPAELGYEVPGSNDVEYHPVVAWEATRVEGSYHPTAKRSSHARWVDHFLHPIVNFYTNVDELDNEWAVKRPDGKFEVMGVGVYDAVEEWLASIAEIHKKAGLHTPPPPDFILTTNPVSAEAGHI